MCCEMRSGGGDGLPVGWENAVPGTSGFNITHDYLNGGVDMMNIVIKYKT